MPNYVAGNLGGIGGSGVYQQDTRPKIDVGGIVDSISKAYQNNREGVLQRAVMQAQNQRANEELGLRKQEQEIQLRAMGWRPADEVQGTTPPTGGGAISQAYAQPPQQTPPMTLTPSAAPSGPLRMPSAPLPGVGGLPSPGAVQPLPGAVAPAVAPTATPAAGPTTAGPEALPGYTPPRMTLNGKDYVLGQTPQVQREVAMRRQMLVAANQAHPGLFTDAEIQYGPESDRVFAGLTSRAEAAQARKQDYETRLTSLEHAVDAQGNPLSDTAKGALARDETAYRQYINSQLYPKPERESAADRIAAEEKVHRDNRIFDAAHPVRGEGGTTVDPYDKFANPYINTRLSHLMAPVHNKYGPDTPGLDFQTAYDQAVHEAQQRWPKWQGGQAAPAAPAPHGKSGNIDLGKGTTDAATADFAQAASLYHQALNQPGVDPEHVRQVYNAAVAKLARKHGMMK